MTSNLPPLAFEWNDPLDDENFGVDLNGRGKGYRLFCIRRQHGVGVAGYMTREQVLDLGHFLIAIAHSDHDFGFEETDE